MTEGSGSQPPAPDAGGGTRWYAVSTHPHNELRAVQNLERQGWRSFLPRIARTIRSGRRVRTELRPLFPGYAFVALDIRNDRWRSVDGTFGVRHLVRTGDVPSPLPGGVVEALQAMAEPSGRITFGAALEQGGQVRFLCGPFADMVGALESLDGNGRVRVLLHILGRETAVHAAANELIPLR